MKRFSFPAFLLAILCASVCLAAPVLNTVNLYLPDERAEGFIVTPIEIEATPQSVVDSLIQGGALPEGVLVRSFALRQEQDQETPTSGKLDLSKEFGDAISSTGTAGETMLMGSVVNTFLTYYQLREITVTSEGAVIETGHRIYDQPMTFFKTDETT